jgi:6-phosphogluconolactonase (cycloisomerase 2 family)
MAEGIVLLSVASNGSLVDRGLAVVADSPSYLVRGGDVIYAVGEAAPSLSAFSIHGDELHFAGTQDAAGPAPCALAVLGANAVLAAACYGDGTIDLHPLSSGGAILKTGQTLRGVGKGPRINQDGPHAHAVLQVDSSTVLTTDLGSDVVYIHSFDGALLTRIGRTVLPAGSGPRDLLRHPSGVVWVLTELSHEIYVLDGSDFSIVSRVALPGALPTDNSAAIALSDDGRFAYAGSRGSDTIAVLGVAADGRDLTPITSIGSGGGWPRHLVVDGPYLRVANQLTNEVVTFEIGNDGIPVYSSSQFVPSPTYLLLD